MTDVVTLVMNDHRTVETLYAQHKTATDDQKQLIGHELVKEICKHANAEEMTLYPFIKANVPNGDQIISHCNDEHTEVETELYKLDGMKPTESGYDSMWAKAMADLQHHVQDEEQNILPHLKKAVDQAALIKLGEQFLASKKAAPTRPHPSAPKEGIQAKIAKTMAKPIDAARDALRESKMNS